MALSVVTDVPFHHYPHHGCVTTSLSFIKGSLHHIESDITMSPDPCSVTLRHALHH